MADLKKQSSNERYISGGRPTVTLVDKVREALADCPRTAGEVALYLGISREDASKALATLVIRGRARISEELDPDNGRKIYEAEAG